jgi:Glyoxalase-like domain
VSVRIRQLVLVVRDLEASRRELEEEFAIEECFRDPGVGKYHLHNVLLPVGDAFLELVSPLADEAPAARYLERVGSEGGYMLIVQVDDFDAAAERAERAGVRIVEKAEREDQKGWHIHPSDLPGAIVSFDWADPPEAWHWAGEDWQRHVRTQVVDAITGAAVSTSDPPALARRWHEVLGGELDETQLRLDGTVVRFEPWQRDDARLTAIELRASDRGDAGRTRTIRGVEFRLL